MLRRSRPRAPALRAPWLAALAGLAGLAGLPLAGSALAAPLPPASVAVVRLDLTGEISEGLRRALRQRFAAGLSAAGLRVIEEERVAEALRSVQPGCADAACLRRLAGTLGCRFVAGGTVRGEDRSYAIELWLADGYTGEVVARVPQSCEICGLEAVAEKMDLAASALRARIEAASSAPARIRVRSEPGGALILVDGDPVGPSPRELELAPGPHRIQVRLDGHLPLERRVTAVAGVDERLELRLVPASSPSGLTRTLGWAALGASIASFSVAVALFALNGQPAGCAEEERIPGGQCPQQLDTRAGAWTAFGLGIGAAAASGYLLYRGYRSERRGQALAAAGDWP